jgi:hypothetical protein
MRGFTTFLLWCLLLVFSWPLAILAIVVFPLIWLAALPFRVVGFTVEAMLALVKALLFLPARLLSFGRPALGAPGYVSAKIRGCLKPLVRHLWA